MKLLELTGLLALIALFFYIAFSTLPNIAKIIVIAASLFASGAIVARLTASSNYYGLVVVKGKYGFGLMKTIAQRYARIVNQLADLGLSIGFGAFYSFALFKATPKFAVHLLVLILIFAGAAMASTSNSQAPLAVVGVLFGLAGMGLVSIALNAFAILTVPSTPAGVLPVVPGVTVPWEAVFAIVLIAVIHETSHGVLFYIEKLKVKNSGALLLGFLPIGAFVEPDEKQFSKHNLHGRRRILVAGSASNFYTVLALLPFFLLVGAFTASLTNGVSITSITSNSPAALTTLSSGDVVTGINGVSITSVQPLVDTLKKLGPGGAVSLSLASGKTVDLKLDDQGKLGVQIAPYVSPVNSLQYSISTFFEEVLKWAVLLSLALATINLLPLFVTDGHHLIRDEFKQLFKHNEKLANLTTNALAGFILLLIIINALPLFN